MRVLLFTLLFLMLHLAAEAQTGTFRVRRGREVITRSRDFQKDSVMRYWYFGGPWQSWCGGCWGTSNPDPAWAVRIGRTSPYQIIQPENKLETDFRMTELGLMKYKKNAWVQYLGFNASMNSHYSIYGVEFYAMKRLIQVNHQQFDLLMAGMGANIFSTQGLANYGAKPYLALCIPAGWFSNFELDGGYHFFLSHTPVTPKNGLFYSLSFKYPIFGR